MSKKLPQKNANTSIQVILATVEKDSAPLIKRLSKATIATNKDYDAVATELKQLKAIRKLAVEKIDALFIDPAKLIIANAKSFLKPFLDKVDALEDEKKTALLGYKQKQDRESMKVMKDLDDGKIKNIGMVITKQAALTVTSGAVKSRKTAQVKCLDAKKTPRLYLVPDERAILADLKLGKKIAGWEIEYVESLAI